MTPLLEEVAADRLRDIETISSHLEISLNELIHRQNLKLAELVNQRQSNPTQTGLAGLIAQAENRLDELNGRLDNRRLELQQERECSIGDIQHVRRAWVLPHPERTAEDVAHLVKDDDTERIAVEAATKYEEARGWRVESVEDQNRGFDLISRKPHPEDLDTSIDQRFIEVKGRSGTGQVLLSTNEHKTAERLRKDYWLYAAREKDRAADAAEEVRLMYVAATRARDHLILSLFRNDSPSGKKSLAAVVSQHCSETPGLWREIAAEEILGTYAPPRKQSESKIQLKTAQDRQEWIERRQQVIQAASRPASIAATTLAHVEKEEAEGGETAYRRGRGGTNLGRAVHSVLQSVDLETGQGLEEISRAQAAAEGMSSRWKEIADLAQRALESDIVRRAVASGRYYREVFVSAPVEDVLVEGFIDLLFEDDGGLVIVDYKTDALTSQEEIQQSMASYRLQGGAYALALKKSSGRPVTEAVFLFLQPQQEVAIEDLEGAMADAGRAAVA